MIESKGRFYDDGDKFMLLESHNIMVEISSKFYDAPYVTITHSHIEWFVNEFGENDRKKVTDKIVKLEVSFWSAVIQEIYDLEKIEKAKGEKI